MPDAARRRRRAALGADAPPLDAAAEATRARRRDLARPDEAQRRAAPTGRAQQRPDALPLPLRALVEGFGADGRAGRVGGSGGPDEGGLVGERRRDARPARPARRASPLHEGFEATVPD